MALLFNPLTATAHDLQAEMTAGKFDSAYLVDVYLAQIQKHNNYLKAVIATAPRSKLLEQARALDSERLAGKTRSVLHGIPILVKDNIATHPDMGLDTTAGSLALASSRPKRNADVIDKLVAAGAIILGKANLSEFSYHKGTDLLCGWSAVGGQSQSAYVRGGIASDDTFGGHSNPGGSSSGPAIAVSAGFAPISIGTETEGSLIMPGGRAALYTIKPTCGITSLRGIVPISDVADAVGPMAKSVKDLVSVLEIITDSTSTTIPTGGYTVAMKRSWSELRVGVLDPASWKWPDLIIKPDDGATKQMLEETEQAYAIIKGLAKTFHANIELISSSELTLDSEPGEALWDFFGGDFKRNIENYLADLETSPVRTLEEVVEFNKKHADVELPPEYPSQALLEKSIKVVLNTTQRQRYLDKLRDVGRARGIDAALAKYNIDVIIGPAESGLTELVSAAGYPIASIPLGYLEFNGRPFALAAVSTANSEAALIEVMSAWEATFAERRPPPIPPPFIATALQTSKIEAILLLQPKGSVVRTSPNHVHIDSLEFYKKNFNIRTTYMKEPDFYGRLGASNSIVGIMDPDQHRLDVAIRVMEERCQSNKPVDLQTLYRCITMEMISKALFGKSQDLLLSGDEEPPILAQLTLFVNDSGLIKHFPILKYITKTLPTVLGRPVLAGLAKFRAQARQWLQVVRQRRAQGLKHGENGYPTLFDILLEPNVEKGYVVPPTEALVGQAFFFLMAGTDTTSYSLSCATYYVLSHDKVHKRLIEELVAAPRDQYGRFEYKVLEGLPYLSAVVKESLRFSTAVAGNIPRVVPEGGAVVDGYFLPAGTAVSVTHRTIHSNPKLFPQPENFDPLRWLGANSKELDYWNVSFSKGPRRCIGMNLAYLEIFMCLATFLLHFDMHLFETDERSMEWWDKGITVNRKHVKVVATRRELGQRTRKV